MRGVRLACVKPAASVRSEPGSNSQVENSIIDLNHVILNRRELHTNLGKQTKRFTALSPSSNLRRKPRPGVFSLKRDRQSLFQRMPNLSSIPQASPPTFLFLPYSIVKKQTHIRVKTIKPKPESSDPLNPLLAADPRFSLERRTSSLAAPPPSSVSGLIEDTPPDSQQGGMKKNQKNGKLLLFKTYFRFSQLLLIFGLQFPPICRALRLLRFTRSHEIAKVPSVHQTGAAPCLFSTPKTPATPCNGQLL